MNKIILSLCMLIAGSITAIAQCHKPVKLTSSKTEYLDSAMRLQRTEDEKSVIEITDKTIMIAPGNAPNVMSGTVQSVDCNWTVPFKEGKLIVKALMNDDQGERNVTATITGKDGKLTLLFEVAEKPDRKIRVPIDTFEEKQ